MIENVHTPLIASLSDGLGAVDLDPNILFISVTWNEIKAVDDMKKSRDG